MLFNLFERIGLILLTLLYLWIGYFLWKHIYVSLYGEWKMAEVTVLPKKCFRSSQMKVKLDDRIYVVKMAYSECEEGSFPIGSQVPVKVHPKFETIALRDFENPEVGLYILPGAFAVILWSAWRHGRREKRRQESSLNQPQRKRNSARRLTRRHRTKRRR
ncbi:hypothetical protein [Chitinophaga sp.]|uniref:hypothetical protein n=1 Tax=Chitinophaga sp. TaxID=1869181 RepID=UPI002615E912|nr:hypothetical protein [uncultured Chitinophaga sp.]